MSRFVIWEARGENLDDKGEVRKVFKKRHGIVRDTQNRMGRVYKQYPELAQAQLVYVDFYPM